MARRRDEAQQAELTRFVNALAEVAGYAVTADWARDSGYAYPNLTKLRAGTGAVDGYNLLRLIRSAAARAELPPEQLALTVGRATDPGGDRQTILLRLDELAELMAEALEMLRDERAVAREAPLRAREGARTQGRADR